MLLSSDARCLILPSNSEYSPATIALCGAPVPLAADAIASRCHANSTLKKAMNSSRLSQGAPISLGAKHPDCEGDCTVKPATRAATYTFCWLVRREGHGVRGVRPHPWSPAEGRGRRVASWVQVLALLIVTGKEKALFRSGLLVTGALRPPETALRLCPRLFQRPSSRSQYKAARQHPV